MAIVSAMKIFLFLPLVAHISFALPTLNARQSKDATIFGMPLYGTNPWVFSGCNAQQGPALEDVFNKTAAFMKTNVVPSAGLVSSTDAYPAFFSTVDPAFVSPVFKWFDPTLYLSNGRPNFICLNDDVPELAGALKVCSQGLEPYAFTISTNIFLCPAFFDKLKPFPEGPANCPSVDATFDLDCRFVDHNDAVVNQYGVLVHELVHVNSHIQISNYPSATNNATEVYGLNEIIALSPAAQQLNANNYAYFAACVYAGCQSYPQGIQQAPNPGKMVKRGTADTISFIPAVFDDYQYKFGFDAAALAANLTAMGILQLPLEVKIP